MPTPLIAESPALAWAALEDHTVQVTVTPRSGLVMADYGTFTLTIREDPEYPRTGALKAAAASADPVADGWAVSTSAVGTVAGFVVSFNVTVPSGVGYRRYCIDIVADGGTAGRVQIYDCTWLSVEPSLPA